MSRPETLPLVLAGVLLAAGVAADEVRLKDGRVLIGATEVRDEVVRVTTRDGVETVPRAAVQRIRSDAELTAELERLAARFGDAPHARLELARIARDFGLLDRMWELLDGLVEDRAQLAAALRPRLDAFLAEFEGDLLPRALRTAPAERRVKELLLRVRPDTSPGRRAAVAAILAGVTDADAVARLRESARKAMHSVAREVAVRALAAHDPAFLWRTAILDATPELRASAMHVARELGQATQAIDYLASGLDHQSAAVRVRTAEAFANLGDAHAVPYLVGAVPVAAATGGSRRGHVAFLNQESYVRDFDVEVASGAFIADPKIDVLQSGTVFDVTVHSVITHRLQIVNAYRSALHRLTGSDPGAQPERWEQWLAGIERPAGDDVPRAGG